MKILLSLFMIVFFFCAQAQQPTTNQVRLKFHHATSDERACKDLLKVLERYDETNHPLFMGYKGGATMLMAKYVINPFGKLSYFKRGRNFLELAINSDKSNVELRFLRYTIQSNVPSFLGYKSNLSQDRTFLQQALPKLKDNDLKRIIGDYLKQNTASS